MGVMPLDDKLWRLVDLLDRDIARMLDSQAARVAGFEDVDFDPLHGLITYVAGGRPLWSAQVEAIGAYTPDVGMFRWAWSAFERPPGRSKLNVVFSEGQRMGIASLTTGQIPIPSEEQAIRLANAAAAMVHASGVYRTREPNRLTFYAMFEAPPQVGEKIAHSPMPPAVRAAGPTAQPLPRATSRPPGVHTGDTLYPGPSGPTGLASVPKPARSPIMSMLPPPVAPPPPGRQEPALPVSRDRWFDSDGRVAAGPPAKPVREPARELVMPIANAALSAVVDALPQGFQQALLVVDVAVGDGRARFSAVLVASDNTGQLFAVTTPQAVMDGIGTLVVEDIKSGNGRWNRLVVRLSQRDSRVTMQTTVYP
jgi:hypothetical protein